MFSVRRFPTFVIQKPIETYHAALNARSPWAYQLLPQDGLKKYSRSCPWKIVALVVAVFCVFAGFHVVFSRGGDIRSSSTVIDPPRAALSKDDFIAAIIREPVEGLIDAEPIRKKCDGTRFQGGLIWHCAAVVGGVGNVANMWLNCVRYAIEAGATTLILPRLGIRADNLKDLGDEDQSVELSHLFDISYFLESWKQTCPQIRAVVSSADIPRLPTSARSPHLAPSSVKNFEMRKYLLVDPTGWREAFDAWKAKNTVFNNMSSENPSRVWQDLVLAQWNRETHPPDFANSFPRLFRYPIQTRRLASSALWNLEQKLGRPIVADAIVLSSGHTTSSRVNSLGPNRLISQGFMGAHLRVSSDAAAAGWPGYEAQAPFYIAEAKSLNLSTIYLATGSAEYRTRFRADAAKEGVDVMVKEDLLDEQELRELGTLTWDQQALVDFDVLMYSSFFYGFVRSSFTWSVALRRGTLPEAGTPRFAEEGSIDEYRDKLSGIVGRYGDINPEGLWV